MKDITINILLSYLHLKLDFEKIQVVDFWEADLCAIGFTNNFKDKLIYISSFQKEQNQFYVEVQMVNGLEKNKIFESSTSKEIEELLISFLY